MKTKQTEFWVGIFVLIFIGSLLTLALQVSGLTKLYSPSNNYELTASFTHIGSLKSKAKIAIAGVPVGRVTSIKLVKDSYGEFMAEVLMSIDSKYNTIPKDSTAKILTAGLLGDNYVGIEPGFEETFFNDGDKFTLTSQALLLEDLISKFAVGSNSGSKNEK